MAENTRKIARARHTAMGIEYKRSPMDRVFMVINITFFILFTILCIFPFYYLFINTISDNDLVNRGVITLLPKGIHIQNYIALKNVSDFGQSVFISVTRTILGTAVMVLASAFAGYLTTKREMWRRSLWYRALVITMYFNAGLVPWYLNMLGLGLTDNYLGYIIPGIVQPYNIILVKTYIESIPGELEESARIDGATEFQIFWKITMPYMLFITGPSLVTSVIANINNFNVIYLLTNAYTTTNMAFANSNAKETDLLITWLFTLTNDNSNYKMASVIGIVTFLICAVITLLSYTRMISGDKEEEFQ